MELKDEGKLYFCGIFLDFNLLKTIIKITANINKHQ